MSQGQVRLRSRGRTGRSVGMDRPTRRRYVPLDVASVTGLVHRDHRDLSWPDWVVLLALLCRWRAPGPCQLTLDDLRQHTGLDQRTIRAGVKRLAALGIISTEGPFGPNRHASIRLDWYDVLTALPRDSQARVVKLDCYAWSEMVRSDGIDARDAAVLVMMTLLADYRHRTLRFTLAELADTLSMARRTIGRALDILEQRSALTWIYRPARSGTALVQLDRYHELVVPERRPASSNQTDAAPSPSSQSETQRTVATSVAARRALGYYRQPNCGDAETIASRSRTPNLTDPIPLRAPETTFHGPECSSSPTASKLAGSTARAV